MYFPGAATSCCATGVVNSTTDAPPGLSAVPKPMMPTTWTRCGGPLTSTVVKSPTRRRPSVALFLSITTWPAACGACPASRCHGFSAATWFQLPPSVGAPLAGLPSAFPSFPISLVYPKTLPSAAATPGTRLRVLASEALTNGRCSPVNCGPLNTAVARTTASVPL